MTSVIDWLMKPSPSVQKYIITPTVTQTEAREKAHSQRVQDLKDRQAEGLAPSANKTQPNLGSAPTVSQDGGEGAFDIKGWQDWATKMRDEQWAREDELNKRLEERQDSEMQRWAEDARKAGININLALGAQGAESGGYVTSSTGIDTSTLTESMSAEKEKILQESQAIIDKGLQELAQAFEKGENDKDRITSIITTITSAIGNIVGTSIFAKSNLLGKMMK